MKKNIFTIIVIILIVYLYKKRWSWKNTEHCVDCFERLIQDRGYTPQTAQEKCFAQNCIYTTS